MRIHVLWLLGLFVLLHSVLLQAEDNNLASSEMPDWLKDSFLDIAEDVTEAEEAEKKLLLYFHQAGCPYCGALNSRILSVQKYSQKISDRYDIVALDLWGDREVTLADGRVVEEKLLARELGVQFTPTLLVLADANIPSQASIAIRIEGYRPPALLMKSLGFDREAVQSSTSTAMWHTKFSSYEHLTTDKPFALQLYSKKGCLDCDRWQEEVLSPDETKKQLSKFQVFSLAIEDDYIDEQGQKHSGRDFALREGLDYMPTFILYSYDDGAWKKIIHVGSYIKPFHFQSILEYVSSSSYQVEGEFQRYLNKRADSLRAEGKRVTIW